MAKNTVQARKMKNREVVLTDNEATILYLRNRPVLAAKMLLGIELNWIQRLGLTAIWFIPFVMLIWGRRNGKTFVGAMACLLLAMLFPKERVLVVAPSKRQVDWIFLNEFTPLYQNSTYLQSSIIGKIVITNAYNRIKFTNGSVIEGFPVGTSGDKVRGAGASFLWIDEYAQLSESIINLIFKPMLLVKQKGRFNRYLITSSAFYRWNHMWTLFQYYTIKMQLEPKKYYVSNFNYTHLLLSKNLPVEFDQTIINDAKATLTELEFQMEWEACLTPDTHVSTNDGLKYIKDIKKNDLVLTHTGKYQKVLKTFERPVDEELIKIKPYYFKELNITKNHPIYVKRDGKLQWVKAGDIVKTDLLVFPLNKNNNKIVYDLTKYVTNYDTQIVDGIEYIYPRWSSKKGTSNKYAKKFTQQRKSKTKYKSSIPRYIELDEDLSKFLGYYAADGSHELRRVSIHLGKHEIDFQKEVSEIVKRIFGIDSKFNIVENVCNLRVNSRLVSQFITSILPGDCYSKRVPTDIFLQNNFIIKSFVYGYNNGDGCITLKSKGKICDISGFASVSKYLILDIKELLLKLGVQSSYYTKESCYRKFKGRWIFCRKAYKLNIKGNNFRRLFYGQGIDYTIPNIPTSRKSFIEGNYIFYKINNISKYNYSGNVYNFSVENDNSYIANYAIVHNCFPAEATGFFSSKLIEDSTPRPPDKKPIEIEKVGDGKSQYFMGIDAARAEGGSNFSITVLKKKSKTMQVVHCITANGETFQNMTEMIRRRFVDFNVQEIRIDQGGGGLTLKDLLREEWIDPKTGLKLKPLITPDDKIEGIPALRMIHINNEKHNSLIINLKSEMEHSRLLLPMDLRRDADPEMERLGQELIMLKTELQVMTAKPSGRYLRFEVPKKFRTDRVFSTSLAIDCIIEAHRNDYGDDIELAVGSWV